MRTFGSPSQIMTTLCWIALVFYLVSQPPESPSPFPSQQDRAARASFNPELALAVDEDLRDYWQKPDQVLDELGDLQGLKVADIGCGNGYFTRRLLDRVGSNGKVLATDIREEVLISLGESIPERLQDRISLIHANGEGTGIDGKVDVILVVQVLGGIEDQGPFLASLKEIMDQDTRLVIIDSKHITDSQMGFTRPINLRKLQKRLAEQGLVAHPGYPPDALDFLPKQFFFVLQLQP